jgi:hypothetical protein
MQVSRECGHLAVPCSGQRRPARPTVQLAKRLDGWASSADPAPISPSTSASPDRFVTARRGSASLRIISPAMKPAEREAFLAELHVAVVTVTDDGRGPLAIPLWYDYQPGGEIILVTDSKSAKPS